MVSLVIMVRIFNGNSEIGVHGWSDLGYLIRVRRFFTSRSVTNLSFSSPEKTCFPSHVRNVL